MGGVCLFPLLELDVVEDAAALTGDPFGLPRFLIEPLLLLPTTAPVAAAAAAVAAASANPLPVPSGREGET